MVVRGNVPIQLMDHYGREKKGEKLHQLLIILPLKEFVIWLTVGGWMQNLPVVSIKHFYASQ